MARPTFKIDPNRLRSLRKESSLTQLQVAKKAHAILGKSTQTTDSTILSSYQRIERTGDTSNAMATALAQVFETTVEILQGGAPEDSVSVVNRIEQQLREQKKLGGNLAFQGALAQHIKTYSGPIEEDDCMRDFAEDIGVEIDIAQIGQNSSEIARLAELTGWSETQLQQSGRVHGHWLLMTTEHGSLETEIILGIHPMLYQIRETFEKRMKWQESDIRITLRRSLPWYHVEIAHPRIPAWRYKFSFVRCRPEVSGLKWVNPTWRDQFQLEQPLEEWAFSKANFCTDFDGKNRLDDVRQLRFRVLERDANGIGQRVAYSKGDLEDLPEQVFQNFMVSGSSHSLVINWLAGGLARSLAPLLITYPSDCWRIYSCECRIDILLDIPFRLLRTNKGLIDLSGAFNGCKYRIDLVEETSPGVYQSAPWRHDSVVDVSGLLEKHVFKKFDDIDHQDALQFLSLPVSPS